MPSHACKVSSYGHLENGLAPQFQRPKPRGKPIPAHIRRGKATWAKVRAKVEHVFAAQKRRLGLIVRTVGLARATAKITLANLAYNMRRLVWIDGASKARIVTKAWSQPLQPTQRPKTPPIRSSSPSRP
jgi:hypothetical protein